MSITLSAGTAESERAIRVRTRPANLLVENICNFRIDAYSYPTIISKLLKELLNLLFQRVRIVPEKISAVLNRDRLLNE